MTNCESCRWYEPSRVSLGHCRKNPPTTFRTGEDEYVSTFPEVHPEDWCGQWQKVIDDVTPGANIVDAWQNLCDIGQPGRKALGR